MGIFNFDLARILIYILLDILKVELSFLFRILSYSLCQDGIINSYTRFPLRETIKRIIFSRCFPRDIFMICRHLRDPSSLMDLLCWWWVKIWLFIQILWKFRMFMWVFDSDRLLSLPDVSICVPRKLRFSVLKPQSCIFYTRCPSKLFSAIFFIYFLLKISYSWEGIELFGELVFLIMSNSLSKNILNFKSLHFKIFFYELF